MNQFKTYFLSLAAGRISTQRLSSRFEQPLIIHPFYHAVSNVYIPHLTPLHKPPTFGKFREDLDFLLRHFQAVDAEDVLLHATGEKRLKSNAFHLSFDDGLKEVYTEVMPYLYHKGIPATVFVSNELVTHTQLFYRHKAALLINALTKRKPSPAVQKSIEVRLGSSAGKTLAERIKAIQSPQREILDEIAPLLEVDFEHYLHSERPYITTKQLFEMRKKGFSIGGQGVDRQPFSGLSRGEQISQIVASIGFVRHIVLNQHRYFAFPNDEAVSDTLLQAIYRKSKRGAELTFDSRGVGTCLDGRHISRIAMEPSERSAKETINRALLGIPRPPAKSR